MSRSEISAKLVSIDAELAQIDLQMKTLRKRKQTLLEQKQKIERRIDERNVAEEGDEEARWEGDGFPWSAECARLLVDVFHLDSFRPLQRSVINSVLSKEDTLIVMSTGGGKSLCYQLPAVLSNGVVLVVSPLISLIEDQLLQLKKLNIEAATLNQSTAKEEVSRIYKGLGSSSTLRLLYVTPEKLAKSKRIMNQLEKCAQQERLKLIAIDEVHCCSQWGHDFRPDFKFLNVLKRQFKGVPILGLTATATAEVLDDVKNMLGIPAARVFRAPFNRPNLFYEVRAKPSTANEFVDALVALIKDRFDGQSGIIYCFSRKECEELTTALRQRQIRAAHYHANMESDRRSRAHEKWINGDVKVIVATVAFGMGIDKPDVRFVIHHSLPKSVENYYQESGRAGRDGFEAVCVLYYRIQDVFRQSTMVCTEKTGITNLYSIVAYCLQTKECRRAILAEHFNVDWDSSMCVKMCDCCTRVGATNGDVDVTPCWRSMLRILDQQGNSSSKDSNGRITGLKLVELASKSERAYSKIAVETILAKLLLRGYFQEDFHFTPYSIISYILMGPQSCAFAKDASHRVSLDLGNISGVEERGAKPLHRKRARPASADSSDDDVIPL